jgi:hypothetical protein
VQRRVLSARSTRIVLGYIFLKFNHIRILLNNKDIITCVHRDVDHKQSFNKLHRNVSQTIFQQNYIPCLYMQGHLEASKCQQGAPPNSSWTVLIHQVYEMFHQYHAPQYWSTNGQKFKAWEDGWVYKTYVPKLDTQKWTMGNCKINEVWYKPKAGFIMMSLNWLWQNKFDAQFSDRRLNKNVHLWNISNHIHKGVSTLDH